MLHLVFLAHDLAHLGWEVSANQHLLQEASLLRLNDVLIQGFSSKSLGDTLILNLFITVIVLGSPLGLISCPAIVPL